MATQDPLVCQAQQETLAWTATPGPRALLDSQERYCHAESPERLDHLAFLVALESQVTKATQVVLDLMDGLVLMGRRAKEETLVMEDRQDPKGSLGPGETLDSPAYRAQASQERRARTANLVVQEPRESPA